MCDRQRRAGRSAAEQDANNAVRDAERAGQTAQQRALHAARQANNRAQQPTTYRCAESFPADASMQQHDLGHMEHECPRPLWALSHCKALHWAHECTKGRVTTDTTSYGMCCMHGAVQLPAVGRTLEPLNALLKDGTAEADHFLHNIRHYNAVFQMTSTGANSYYG